MIGAVLLAGGASRRFGAANKLLAELDGRAVVARAADALGAAGLPVLAVLGHEADAVRAALEMGGADEGARAIRFAVAADWEAGMGRVIAAGVAAAPAGWRGALVALGDMPFVDPGTLDAIARGIECDGDVVVPVHGGRRGNPVGFGRGWFARLAALEGDHGARALIGGTAVREVEAPAGVLHDIDTPADLGGWRARAAAAISRADPRPDEKGRP